MHYNVGHKNWLKRFFDDIESQQFASIAKKINRLQAVIRNFILTIKRIHHFIDTRYTLHTYWIHRFSSICMCVFSIDVYAILIFRTMDITVLWMKLKNNIDKKCFQIKRTFNDLIEIHLLTRWSLSSLCNFDRIRRIYLCKNRKNHWQMTLQHYCDTFNENHVKYACLWSGNFPEQMWSEAAKNTFRLVVCEKMHLSRHLKQWKFNLCTN